MKGSMRIALVTNSFLPRIGGAEVVAHNLARQWAHDGHEVCVITPPPAESPDSDPGYSIHTFRPLRGSTRFGYHRAPFLGHASRRVNRILERYRPDFISAHFAYPTALWLSKSVPSVNYIVTPHGGEINPQEKARKVFGLSEALAHSMNEASGIIAISRYVGALLEEMGVERDRIHFIPNGVDCDRFNKPVIFDLRARFGIHADAPVILSVGRNDWSKAFDTGIRAFAGVHEKYRDAFYVILGRDTRKWIPLVRELDLEGNVFFSELHGDDMIGAYRQSTLFFSSSVSEGCPVALLEAMAAGLPSVVTNVSGSQDLITTGENGIVTEPGDPGAMADAISELLADESLRSRYGDANRERARSYDWPLIARRYLDLA
jgi:glycosyltransferase involved in cell wall biosynthesis